MRAGCRMRVLWFVHVGVAAMRKRLGSAASESGSWVDPLLRALASRDELELGVCWAGPGIGKEAVFDEGGVRYFCLPCRPAEVRLAGWHRQWPFGGRMWRKAVDRVLRRCENAVASFKPDLIHIHGTERPYGLLAETTNVPVAISIQGVLQECLRTYFGRMPLAARLRVPKLLVGYVDIRRRAALERRIYRACRYFLGRTHWDRSYQCALSPSAAYFHAEEMVRPELFGHMWHLKHARLHRLYVTSSCSLFKGLETLLEAVALLRASFPRLRLRIAGNYPAKGLGGYFRRRVRVLGLEHCVDFLGWIGPEKVAEELQAAHVFALPSFVENSPLSLAEAQVVGTPVVASWAGGIPSRVKDEVSGLLFPPGDVATLAFQLRRVLEDNSLALQLAAQAQKEAMARHNPERVVPELTTIYRAIMDRAGGIE